LGNSEMFISAFNWSSKRLESMTGHWTWVLGQTGRHNFDGSCHRPWSACVDPWPTCYRKAY